MQAEKLISAIDPKRYPEKLGNVKVRSTIEQMKEQFVGYSSLFVDAKPLLKNIPSIFGSKKEKVTNWTHIRRTIGKTAELLTFRAIKRRPLVLPVVIEV